MDASIDVEGGLANANIEAFPAPQPLIAIVRWWEISKSDKLVEMKSSKGAPCTSADWIGMTIVLNHKPKALVNEVNILLNTMWNQMKSGKSVKTCYI